MPFTVGYDAALINPDDAYVVVGGLIDGSALWASPRTPIAPDATYDLTLALTGSVIPGQATPTPEASATPGASGTPETSQAPGELPSSQPSITPEPTATPTEAPTATPTEAPTATPTEAPTASVTPAPSESAQPSESAAPSESPIPVPGTVTGQATYKEPATLTDASVLTVVVVQVNGPAVETVGEQQIRNTGPVPISFSVTLDPTLLDPTKDAFLYASLVDGTNAWTSDSGIKVATNGAPTTDVQVPLVFRPDLIEGQVTGAITDLPSDISLNAWAMAFVINQSDGSILGLTSGPIYGSTLVPFQIPFPVENVDRTQTYLAAATVFDDTRTFRSAEGVPVITNGNPYTNVVLPVIEVSPSPTPSLEATPTAAPPTTAPTPAPTTAPVATATPTTSSGSTGGGIDPLVLAGVAGILIVGLIVVVIIRRR